MRRIFIIALLVMSMGLFMACTRTPEDNINNHLLSLTTVLEEGRSNPEKAIKEYRAYCEENKNDIRMATKKFQIDIENMDRTTYRSVHKPVFDRYDAIYNAFLTDFPTAEDTLMNLTDDLPTPK